MLIYGPSRRPESDEPITAAPQWFGIRVTANHILPVIVGLLFASLVAGLIYKLTRPDKLSMGSTLPVIPSAGASRAHLLALRPGRTNVLVYYRADCPACRSELAMLSRDIGRLGTVNVLMVSGDPPDSVRAFSRKWPALFGSDDLQWIAVNGAVAESELGIRGTPTIFVFGADGRLRKKILGEASVDAILAETGRPQLSALGKQVSLNGPTERIPGTAGRIAVKRSGSNESLALTFDGGYTDEDA